MKFWYFVAMYQTGSHEATFSGVAMDESCTFPLVKTVREMCKFKKSNHILITFWGEISEKDYLEYQKTLT